MSKVIKVVVIDDSSFNRETIVQTLNSHPDFEVIGTASDGEVGLKLAMTLSPDLVTLDLEMPRMDGFTFLRLIMEQKPMPVLVVSAHSRAQDVFNALDLGAYDFVAKSKHFFPGEISERLRAEILRKARVARHLRLSEDRFGEFGSSSDVSDLPTGSVRRIACIGASTGGPRALRHILSRLPGGGGTAYLIAQHMPVTFTSAFAERLDRAVSPKVILAENNAVVLPGYVYICPGGHNLELRAVNGTWKLRVRRVEFEETAPSVDVLFQSVAKEYDGSVLGILLTGMGTDGGQGMQALMDVGGHTVAESAETAAVFGMPKEAVDRGAAKEVLPLGEIGKRLSQFARGEGVRSG